MEQLRHSKVKLSCSTMVAKKDTISATCRVMFGHTIMEKGKPVECAIILAADGSDSVEHVKEKIAVRRSFAS